MSPSIILTKQPLLLLGALLLLLAVNGCGENNGANTVEIVEDGSALTPASSIYSDGLVQESSSQDSTTDVQDMKSDMLLGSITGKFEMP